MIDVRCKNCDKLLLKAAFLAGAIKCPRCSRIFEYQVFSNVHLTNQEDPEISKAYLQSLNSSDKITTESTRDQA